MRIRLLRYRGGNRGPVIGAHGMGASSGLFSLDTIDQNLTEYLCGEGFDVWLLDWRSSALLPAADGLFTADDCAHYDFPAAAAKVREVTGAEQVHWVVHCVGSIVFFMSALSALEPGRDFSSVAALQVGLHQDTPWLTDLKVRLRMPALLQWLGIDHIDADTWTGRGWKDWLFNQALRLYPLPPEERCASAVCRRITFLYSLCYRHENLNEATHATMHERMGVANLPTMEQLARCTLAGHLVDAAGDDVYLPNLERLRGIPITFLHGSENQVWQPRSTQLSLELLTATVRARRLCPPRHRRLRPLRGPVRRRQRHPLLPAHPRPPHPSRRLTPLSQTGGGCVPTGQPATARVRGVRRCGRGRGRRRSSGRAATR